MATHGGGFPKSGLVPPKWEKAGTSGKSGDVPVSGFRNFLGGSGEVVHPRENTPRLRELMQRLSRRMSTGVDGMAASDNASIPSGYTYLLQFVAHDLVATSIPFWALDDASLGVRNERTSRLRLDTLYGGGPAFNPAIYAPDNKADTSRTMLRMGCIEKKPSNPGACPFRDIARAGVAGASGVARQGLSEALIADPRNDDHVIISQFTALFQALHNAIVEQLPVAPTLLSGHKRFVCARDATTLIYRHIVRNELLPLILHEAVRQHYEGSSPPPFIDTDFAKNPSGPLPLEFSHGAFRFGHAMVRDDYQINTRSFTVPQLMKQTSSRNPDRMPLGAAWMVNWSRFFPLGGNVPANLSRLIGPTVSPLLMDDQLFGPIDESNWHGLAYRDLMSAALAGVSSVRPLIDKIRVTHSALIDKANALKVVGKDPAWKQELKTWLEQAPTASGLDADDIKTLLDDPPLPFFVLMEAKIESDGTRLGVLGSIIIADVLYALLEEGGRLAMKANPDLEEVRCTDPRNITRQNELKKTSLRVALVGVSEEIYGVNKLDADVLGIISMADLIKFVAKRNGWEATQPPFI